MGTHPIFESDFDCLTDMETLPVKTTRQRSTNRWQIETPSPRDRELVAPVGYSNQRIALSQSQANQRQGPDTALLEKRNWDIALKNFKSIPMPILMIGGYLFSAFSSLMNIRSVSEQLAKNSPDRYMLHVVVWIAGQLTSIACLMWKCNRMGLLPTHESDWLAFKAPLTRTDWVSGGSQL